MRKRKRGTRRRLTLRDRLHDDLCIAESNGRNAVLDTLSSVAFEINRYRAALMPDADIESVRPCPSPNCFGLCFRKEKEFTRSGKKHVLISHKCVDCGYHRSYSFPVFLRGTKIAKRVKK